MVERRGQTTTNGVAVRFSYDSSVLIQSEGVSNRDETTAVFVKELSRLVAIIERLAVVSENDVAIIGKIGSFDERITAIKDQLAELLVSAKASPDVSVEDLEAIEERLAERVAEIARELAQTAFVASGSRTHQGDVTSLLPPPEIVQAHQKPLGEDKRALIVGAEAPGVLVVGHDRGVEVDLRLNGSAPREITLITKEGAGILPDVHLPTQPTNGNKVHSEVIKGTVRDEAVGEPSSDATSEPVTRSKELEGHIPEYRISDPELIESYAAAERIILFLLQTEGFTYDSQANNAGGEMRQVISEKSRIHDNAWATALSTLKQRGIITTEPAPKPKRTKSITLDVRVLSEVEFKYVTARVKRKLSGFIDDGTLQIVNPESASAKGESGEADEHNAGARDSGVEDGNGSNPGEELAVAAITLAVEAENDSYPSEVPPDYMFEYKKPDPKLNRRSAVAEQIILFLLTREQYGFVGSGDDFASNEMKALICEEASISPSDWKNALAYLRRLGILLIQNEDGLVKIRSFTLRLDGLHSGPRQPFVTARVERVKQAYVNGQSGENLDEPRGAIREGIEEVIADGIVEPRSDDAAVDGPNAINENPAAAMPLSGNARRQNRYETRREPIRQPTPPTAARPQSPLLERVAAELGELTYDGVNRDERALLSDKDRFALALLHPSIGPSFTRTNNLLAAVVSVSEIDLSDSNGQYDPAKLPKIIKALKDPKNINNIISFTSGDGKVQLTLTEFGRKYLRNQVIQAKIKVLESRAA